MKNAIVIIFFFTSFTLKAQSKNEVEIKKVSTEDSIGVGMAFQKFIKAFEDKNQLSFLELCLPQVDCANCHDRPRSNNFISKKSLYKNSFKDFATSAVYKALKKRGYNISVMEIKNYKPKNLPKSYSKNLVLYEVWVQTFLPNEWAEGHEGQSNSFQFVKIKNEYKLFGLSSVP